MTKEEKDRLLRLYELLWEEIKDETLIPFGLCYEIDRLAISSDEHRFISDSLMRETNHNYEYKWSLTEEGTAQRKSFVLEHIEKLKNEE